MMFESHIAFAMTLLVLVAAAALLGFAAKTEACCKCLMKTIAYVVLVLAGLNLLCSTYYTVRYWKAGYFKNQQCMMMKGHGDMMRMMDMSNPDDLDAHHGMPHPGQDK